MTVFSIKTWKLKYWNPLIVHCRGTGNDHQVMSKEN